MAKLDRLSRSLVDFAQVMATAQKEKWSINALDIGIDTSSINGELIAHIIMALAQWERRIIGSAPLRRSLRCARVEPSSAGQVTSRTTPCG